VNNDDEWLMNESSSLDDSYHITTNAYLALGQDEQYHSEEVSTRTQSPIETFNPPDVWHHDFLESNFNSNDDKTMQFDPRESKGIQGNPRTKTYMTREPPSLQHHDLDDDEVPPLVLRSICRGDGDNSSSECQ
jgi:hypothetical protein